MGKGNIRVKVITEFENGYESIKNMTLEEFNIYREEMLRKPNVVNVIIDKDK